MRPVDQTIFSDPVAGTKGNCFQALIATLLELPLEQVPHFIVDGPDTWTFRQRVNNFLRPMNLAFVDIPPFDLDTWSITGLHHDAAGWSPRNIYHATAAIDGAIVHDPHPSRAGLKAAETWGLFIVLDPSKPIGIAS